MVCQGVLLHQGRVDAAGVDPLGFGSPASSVPAVHGSGKDGLGEEGEGEEEADKLGGEGQLPTTWGGTSLTSEILSIFSSI